MIRVSISDGTREVVVETSDVAAAVAQAVTTWRREPVGDLAVPWLFDPAELVRRMAALADELDVDVKIREVLACEYNPLTGERTNYAAFDPEVTR